jgi:hypothetical protein
MTDNQEADDQQTKPKSAPQNSPEKAGLGGESAAPLENPESSKRQHPPEQRLTRRRTFSDLLFIIRTRWDVWRQKRRASEKARLTDKVITLATIVIAGTAILQLFEMRNSGKQTDKIIAADERLAGAMEKSVGEADASLKQTQNSFRDDQRAWVGPYEVLPPAFTDAGKAAFMKEGEKASFGFMITNTGKTPAKNVSQSTSYIFLPLNEKFVPHYPGAPQKVGVIQPNARVRAQAPDTERITKPIINSLTSDTYRFYVFGKVTYDDISGRDHHTMFCIYLVKDLSNLTYCDTYNDAD